MATFRKDVDELRKQFETLKRVRLSLRLELADAAADDDGPSSPKRKRWGKRSTIRRRRR